MGILHRLLPHIFLIWRFRYTEHQANCLWRDFKTRSNLCWRATIWSINLSIKCKDTKFLIRIPHSRATFLLKFLCFATHFQNCFDSGFESSSSFVAAKIMTGYAGWRHIDINDLQIKYAIAIDSGDFSQNHRDIVASTGTVNNIVRSITKATIRTGPTLRRIHDSALSIATSIEF